MSCSNKISLTPNFVSNNFTEQSACETINGDKVFVQTFDYDGEDVERFVSTKLNRETVKSLVSVVGIVCGVFSENDEHGMFGRKHIRGKSGKPSKKKFPFFGGSGTSEQNDEDEFNEHVFPYFDAESNSSSRAFLSSGGLRIVHHGHNFTCYRLAVKYTKY